ncbi:glycerol-3-phosphate 1-O-acyltransferase PlsY [Aromatoleum petrolei]|uniref:Glycerol-3-phosphate acyltransferase n=1 Tax=Aromatoleum petrolei TaxID=76116 RepID=A0ABX1MZR9_9RHOO|nr:glycerol-3-phosphate 1-O-acyltransferase PlsY [Aromatoleum petrolei]NMF91604.1 glycerol-3-phosphate 1-O-acyltransferase PlsY [Aromatoleum petrolei]QTQ35231.1 Glycerol-3-phosphate acyltransferase [Aromatoleum petrolei]
MTLLPLLLAAYLLGSIPFAIVSSRLFGLADPRKYGSGNPGATNVLRSGNKAAALLTLVGDCAKGWLAVWGAARLGFDTTDTALAGLAAFLGHVFSVFLRFNGGKGVATALGVLLGINPWVALAALATWVVIAFTTRYSSAAALSGALATPVAGYVLLGTTPVTGILALIAAILIWRHSPNIRKLLNGTESRIGGRKA